MMQSLAIAMKEVAGCCKTDLYQTNEADSCVSALCDGDWWGLGGECGVLSAAKVRQNETLLVRRKEV
jgi:hypothetical protein